MIRVGVLAIAAAVAGAAAVGAGQQPVFRGGVDLVNFGVSVSDREGNFITDLTPEDFEVVEDGVPQTLTYFARGEDSLSAPELHVGLLFDTSGSMGQDIQLSRSAAIRFLNTLGDAKDMTLVDFDTEVRVATYGQADFPRLVERIRGRRPDGWTAMYDALGVYLDGAAENEGRTILVVYTDGGDTRSTIAFGDVLTLIRASDVTIYTVGFLQGRPSGARFSQRSRLSQIAEAAGGEAFFPVRMEDVEEAYDRIVAQIRAQYSLGYVSTNTTHDGQWRRVQIRVTRPDLRNARIQTRDGYFALYKEEP
jgi:Ca-activated chloride channel family protein